MPRSDQKWILLGLGAAGLLALGYYLWGGKAQSPTPTSTQKTQKQSVPVHHQPHSSLVLDDVIEPTTPRPAPRWTEKAKVAMAANDWETAISCWTAAIEECEAARANVNFRYYTNRASCFLNLGRVREAETDCRTSLNLANTDPNHGALLNLAKALNAQSKYEDAIQTVNRVIAQSKDSKQVLQAKALKTKFEQAQAQAQGQTKSASKVTINLDGPSTQSFPLNQSQSLDQPARPALKPTPPTSIDQSMIAPPPAFRRQDTEEDLVNLDQEPHSPAHPTNQTIEHHDHVFSVNHPPISFAEIVKHEPVEQTNNQPNTQSDILSNNHSRKQSINQPTPDTNVQVPVLPHGSFASVVAHSVDHSNDQSNNASNNQSTTQSAVSSTTASRKQSINDPSVKQSMTDSLNLIAQHEADEAMRHRALQNAEISFYQTHSQSLSQSTNPDDDLTSSGVLINESDVQDQTVNEQPNKQVKQFTAQPAAKPFDEMIEQPNKSSSNEKPAAQASVESVEPAADQKPSAAQSSKPVVPQTVLPLAGSWNKQPNSQATNQPTNQSGVTSPPSEPSNNQSSKQSTAPTTPQRKPQQKKKQPQSGKKPSNSQHTSSSSNQSGSQSNNMSHPQSPLVSPKGPTPVEVPPPAGGKSWASLIKK